MDNITTLLSNIGSSPVSSAAYAILLTFVLSNFIAFTYEKTFQGLSYSRNFIQALILGSIVVSVAMQAIGDNVARGIGMAGALTLIRFRSSLKDPKDMIFIFSALAIGIATGVHAYATAAIGTAGFCLAAFAVFNSPFGKDTIFDGLLRFNIENNGDDVTKIEGILQDRCKRYSMITLRDLAQGGRSEYAYQVKLKDKVSPADLSRDLAAIASMRGLSILLQESTIEL
jgi:Domain of unknown function (DUF4956)